MSCASWETNAGLDVVAFPTDPADHMNPAACYLGPERMKQYMTHPYASPLFGDFRGLPPTSVQGDCEVLRDEITLLTHKATLAGVKVTHEIYEDAVSILSFSSTNLGKRFAPVDISSFRHFQRYIKWKYKLLQEPRGYHHLYCPFLLVTGGLRQAWRLRWRRRLVVGVDDRFCWGVGWGGLRDGLMMRRRWMGLGLGRMGGWRGRILGSLEMRRRMRTSLFL